MESGQWAAACGNNFEKRVMRRRCRTNEWLTDMFADSIHLKKQNLLRSWLYRLPQQWRIIGVPEGDFLGFQGDGMQMKRPEVNFGGKATGATKNS